MNSRTAKLKLTTISEQQPLVNNDHYFDVPI
jgi:hypothetical protein